MAGEHLRVGDRPLAIGAAAVHDEHRGAVLGRGGTSRRGRARPTPRKRRPGRRRRARSRPARATCASSRCPWRSGRARATRGARPRARRPHAGAPGWPSPRCRHGMTAARAIRTTPATAAGDAREVGAGRPAGVRRWPMCIAPLTSANRPNENDSAACSPGRRRGNATMRPRRRQRDRPASACWPRPSPGRGGRTRRRARARGQEGRGEDGARSAGGSSRRRLVEEADHAPLVSWGRAS